MDIKVGKQAIREATDKLKNWGRWGADDQIGTLNHVSGEDIVRAASLIRSGRVFALGIPLRIISPAETGVDMSWRPAITSVGLLNFGRSAR